MKQNALQLFLKQKRFDLIFKYIYLNYPENDFVKNAYLENILAFNGFCEIEPSDGVEKNTPEKFLNSFDNLIKSLKKEGFNKDFGIVPLGDNGEISDGAHRLATCAFLNQEVEIELDGRNDLYDYKFFQAQKMNPDIMDYGALEYVKLNPNAYIVNLHSITDMTKDEVVVQILEKYGFVYYKKEIYLTFNGYVNLKKLSYGSFWDRESWIGNVENKFEGAQMHAKQSMGNNPLRAFVFVCDDLQKVINAKAEIRNLFNLGNYSVHINDTREEAIWLAETYFNKNSLDMINNRPLDYEESRFDEMVEELKKIAIQHRVNMEDICGAGSAPLSVYGLRSSSDLDFLYCGNSEFDIQTETLSNHDSELKYYPYHKKEIIENPAYHFYYHGIKFISLDVLYLMKENRNEIPKDVNDCKMIKCFRKKKKYKIKIFKLFEKLKNGNKRKVILFGFIKFTYTKRNK